MFTNRECNLISISIATLFLIVIICLALWATSKSKKVNCCETQTTFKNCQAYFKNGMDMDSENNYKQICKK